MCTGFGNIDVAYDLHKTSFSGELLRTDTRLERAKGKWIQRKETTIFKGFAVKRREMGREWVANQCSFFSHARTEYSMFAYLYSDGNELDSSLKPVDIGAYDVKRDICSLKVPAESTVYFSLYWIQSFSSTLVFIHERVQCILSSDKYMLVEKFVFLGSISRSYPVAKRLPNIILLVNQNSKYFI